MAKQQNNYLRYDTVVDTGQSVLRYGRGGGGVLHVYRGRTTGGFGDYVSIK